MTYTTKYPNLVAEYETTPYPIDTFAEWANMSIDALYAVTYKGDKLQFTAMLAIYNHLEGKLSLKYLYAPKLALVNPHSNRGKYQTYHLQTALENCYQAFDAYHQGQDKVMRKILESANSVVYNLEHGRCVTYASYRKSIIDVHAIRNWADSKEAKARARKKLRAS